MFVQIPPDPPLAKRGERGAVDTLCLVHPGLLSELEGSRSVLWICLRRSFEGTNVTYLTSQVDRYWKEDERED